MGESHAERGGVQGPFESPESGWLDADRQGDTELRRPRDQLHADLVPGMARRRSVRATVVEPGICPATRPWCSAATRTPATGVPASRRHLSEVPHRSQVQRLSRRLLADIDRDARHSCRTARSLRSPIAAGYRSLSRPHSDEEHDHVSQDIAGRGLRGDSCSVGASAGVSPDEAKQLGTTLTPVGAEKAGNKDSTIPEYTGGIKPPGELPERAAASSRSVR